MKPHLEVENLCIVLSSGEARGPGATQVTLVESIGFSVGRGEVLGVVGESGSGKSISCLSLPGLVAPPLAVSGTMRLDGRAYQLNDAWALAGLRGSKIGVIFQDPRASLNPVRTIGSHFCEVLRQRLSGDGRAIRDETLSLLSAAGIGNAAQRLGQYPHQLSGGLCQRVMIALALAARPRVLIADEPTTALDTTVQAQVLDLIDKIRIEEEMAVIFVSHDLAVIADIADRIMVMRGGSVVEISDRDELFKSPRSSYARILVNIAVQGHIDASV